MGQLGIKNEEAFCCSLYNLQKQKIVFSKRKLAWITYYALQFDNHFVNPSLCSNMLLMEDVWNRISLKLNLKEYYIFPVYRDYIFISEKNEFTKNIFTVKEFREILKAKENYYTVPFTDKIFSFADEKISLY